jgi:hypothetical protein
VALVLVLGLGVAHVSASPRQADDSSTTTGDSTVSTTENLLEDSTTVPPTTADPASTTLPNSAGGGSSAGDDTRTVWLIVLALVLIALMLAFLTFRYWQRTRPIKPMPFDQDKADVRPDTDTGAKAERRPVG